MTEKQAHLTSKEIHEFQRKFGGEEYSRFLTAPKDEIKRRQERLHEALRISRDVAGDIAAPWEMVAQAIKDLLRDQVNWDGIQFLGLPREAKWDDPDYGDYERMRVLGDTMPLWQPNSIFGVSDNRFTDGYALITESLDFPTLNPATYTQATDAQDSYIAANNVYKQQVAGVTGRWRAFDAQQQGNPQPMSYQEYYDAFERDDLEIYRQRRQTFFDQYVGFLNTAWSGNRFIADAVAAFDDTNFQQDVLIPDGDGAKEEFRRFLITPDLAQFSAAAETIPAGNPQLNVTLTKDSSRYTASDTTWSEGASISVGFFSFGESASSGRSSIDWTSSSFSLTIQARSIGVFAITPDSWYSGTLLSAIKNGPFQSRSQIVTQQLPLWGPTGILNLRAAQLIVAYQPSVSVTLSDADYQQVTSRLDVNAGFSIGPFGFGGGYSTSTTEITADRNTRTITMKDSTTTPKIIAVAYNFINWP